MHDVPRISVRTLLPLGSEKWAYLVEIIDSDRTGSCTIYKVTMDKRYYQELSKNNSLMPEEFVKKSFEFLLEKEEHDKGELGDEFDISDIEYRYPDYTIYMARPVHYY
jgi:hypothetical protein